MADKIFGLDFSDITTLDGSETISVLKAGALKDITMSNLFSSLSALAGVGTYSISRTVSSNNLTVALKTAGGSDFSSTNPFVFKIFDTLRTLTGALSVNVNAGTNTFNAGSTEIKTLDTDFFVYLGWRASNSSMFILVSRIPYATTYADFSSTATNEKYGAYSGSAPASTDPVVVIGRFNAANSGTASFNWSIPATSIVLNFPIYETRWLDWTPVFAGFSADPTSNVSRYRLINNTVNLNHRSNADGTSNSTGFTISLPFTAKTITNANWQTPCLVTDNSAAVATPGTISITSAATTASIAKDLASTGFTASGGKRIRGSELFYEI